MSARTTVAIARCPFINHLPVDLGNGQVWLGWAIEERDASVADAIRRREDARRLLELRWPAKVNDLSSADVQEGRLRLRRQPVESVCTEERSPPSAAASARRVTTDIPEVARAGNAKVTLQRRYHSGRLTVRFGGHGVRLPQKLRWFSAGKPVIWNATPTPPGDYRGVASMTT